MQNTVPVHSTVEGNHRTGLCFGTTLQESVQAIGLQLAVPESTEATIRCQDAGRVHVSVCLAVYDLQTCAAFVSDGGGNGAFTRGSRD